MLIKEKRTLQPHEAFLEDLAQWLSNYVDNNMEFMICLDANEQWSAEAAIAKFARKFDMLNVNKEMALKPTHPNISNVERSTVIDYCLCSRKVFSNIRYVASTPYDLEVLGDHGGFIIDIDLCTLLNDTHTEEDISMRKLVLSNPQAADKYLKEEERLFDKQNIVQRTIINL